MARPMILQEMRERIAHAQPGEVYIPGDFSDLGEAKKISMSLSRLHRCGVLEKVKRGVYMKPRYSSLLDCHVPPRAVDVAKAVARNYGWTIVPSGDTALNILGLSTQIPAVWLFVSDGPYKTYEAEGLRIEFRHTDRKNELIGVSHHTALLIQALRALGKKQVDATVIESLSSYYSPDEKKVMMKEGRYITGWIYEIIRRICTEDTR